MVEKNGKNGPFLACPGYPECKFTKTVPKGFQSTPTPQKQASVSGIATIVREIKDKPNSYECGKAGARIKIYFNTLEELQKELDMAIQAGLVDDPKIKALE